MIIRQKAHMKWYINFELLGYNDPLVSERNQCTGTKCKKVKMESFLQEKSEEYVLMPWDDTSTITVSESESDTQTYTRWDLIQKLLSTSKISNEQELINIINSYNLVIARNGHQEKAYWTCPVLSQYFLQISELERKNFFGENGVLSTIRILSLQLRKLVPTLRLLRSGFNSSVKLHQLQIASILSNAFLCTFPKSNADCPSINFNTLYAGTHGSVSNYYIEKIKCLMHYFKRIHERQPSGNLSFYRHYIPDHKFPRWDKATASLGALAVDVEGKIEDQHGFLQMDFANKYVGGGVLGRGCVQEEIRFLISPELIAARLFTECLADNESLFVVGAERYCDYSGYSNTFTFTGNFEDKSPFDENRCRKTYLIILDALYFHNSSDQYRESKILRELKKAYVGFKTQEEYKTLPLATGNWGCGAFGGDPQLKALLQLMASSQAQRDMLYLTFGNIHLKNQIRECYFTLKEKDIKIGTLYGILKSYNRERRKNETVFEFVIAAVHIMGERKLIPKSIASTSSKEHQNKTAFEIPSSTQVPKAKRKAEILNEEEKNFPEMNLNFSVLDKEIRNKTKDSAKKLFSQNSNQQKSKLPQENLNIIDVLWYESERDSISSTKEQQEKQFSDSDGRTVRENSPSLFSDEDMEVVLEGSETMSSTNVDEPNTFCREDNHTLFKKNAKENEMSRKTQYKKIIQPKITDCFFKK